MKKTVYLLFIALLLLSGCVNKPYTADNGEKVQKMPAAGDMINKSGVCGESSDLALLFNAENYNLTVKNKKSGDEFSALPDEAVISKIQNQEYLDKVRSQIILEYIDDSKKVQIMNSYSESATLGQIKAYKVHNGIRLVYTIGKTDTRPIVPEIITVEEFENVLNNIGDERLKERMKSSYKLLDYKQILSHSKLEAEELTKKYKSFKSTDLYELRSTTSVRNMDLFEKEFKAQGYNLDKLNVLYKRIGYNLELKKGAVFVIPVDYRIEENTFIAHVYTKEIKEPENAKLTSISVLPQFCVSKKPDDNGYFLVPDGSGAIINFKNSNVIEYYNTKIYGQDQAVRQDSKTSKIQMSYLPCFGMKDGGTGIFSVITRGDAISSLTANTSSNAYPLNCIFNTFAVRTVDFLSYGNKSTESGTNVVSKKLVNNDLEQRFYFLESQNNTYCNMAKLYRDYLIQSGVLSKSKNNTVQPVVCDLLGYYTQKKTMIGIPYKKKMTLSNVKTVNKVTDKLLRNNIENVIINLKGWMNGGYYNGVLNKMNGFNELSQLGKTALKNEKVRFSVSANISNVYNDSAFDSFSAKRDSARYLSKQIVSVDNLTLTTNEKNPLYDEFSYYILGPQAKSNFFKSFLTDYSKRIGGKQGLSIENIILNADYKENAVIDRQTALSMMENDFNYAKSKTEFVMVDTPLIPLIGNATVLKNFPCGTSNYNIESIDVPFYAMVVHGYKEYTAAPINNAQNSRQEFLQAVESGAGLSFIMMDASSEKIKNTPLSSFYSLEYSKYIDDIIELCKKTKNLYETIKNAAIEQHTCIDENAVLIRYDNGVDVIVNYSDKDISYDGLTAPAFDFAFGRR